MKKYPLTFHLVKVEIILPFTYRFLIHNHTPYLLVDYVLYQKSAKSLIESNKCSGVKIHYSNTNWEYSLYTVRYKYLKIILKYSN